MVSAVEAVAGHEQVAEATAVRKLLRMGAERYVAMLYQEGRITLPEAAQRLGVDLIGAADLLADQGVHGNLQATIEQVRSSDHALPWYGERDLRAFLNCGLLQHGFLRLKFPWQPRFRPSAGAVPAISVPPWTWQRE